MNNTASCTQPPYRCSARVGFTIIELLIVVVIIAILAAIVIPQFSYGTTEAKVAQALSNRRAIHNAVLDYYTEHAEYPADVEADWFPNGRVPPNPFAPDWSGDPVQVYDGTDPVRRVPESKMIDVSTNWARPIFYSFNYGDVYFRVPELATEAEMLELFNRINGLAVIEWRQDTP